LLGTEWLPAIVDLDVRLRAEPPARVLDVACGTGWSSIAMSQAYPNINVDGVDLDHDAIGAARRNAERAGVADRVRFSVADAADLGGAGGYDLVTIFEALHDMSRPVDALSAARQVLAEDGTVLVVDGLVAEEFTVPASPRERTEYGWSVVSCLPGAMGDPQTAATGAVMRPSMLHQYALQAGFSGLEVPNPHRLLALLPTAPVWPSVPIPGCQCGVGNGRTIAWIAHDDECCLAIGHLASGRADCRR
jgi:predicted O-methyltransferase YrrM